MFWNTTLTCPLLNTTCFYAATICINYSSCVMKYKSYNFPLGGRGGVVVMAPRYKPTSRGFDSRWFHWNFSVT